MKVPEWLDPRTLRWLADEHQLEAEGWDAHAAELRRIAREKHDVTAAGAAQGADLNARVDRLKAKRLRALATRIERRRR